jgi:aminopeptidase N
VGVACEGFGASSWWPCKDHLSDEPDSMQMTFTAPTGLVCVSNGILRDTTHLGNGFTAWRWRVSYPINIYNVTLNLAHYSRFTDTYSTPGGNLLLDYYVLDYNVPQATLHFQQVKPMMACFEKYFGPYPFPHDSYKLVETPYWGMEHQSAIAYGNEYINNKEGFDFIIIHESAHEWWGNAVGASDFADLWIHESFANYAEALYLECMQSYPIAEKYLMDIRWQIRDAVPIVGPRKVNYQHADNDLYHKGAWILHTLRSVMNNDSVFFSVIKGLQSHFYLSEISTEELVNYVNETSGHNFSWFFTQYLYHPSPPVLEYKLKQKGKDVHLSFRWVTDVKNFSMPVEVTSSYQYTLGNETKTYQRIIATNEWQSVTLQGFETRYFDVRQEKYYVKKREVK